MITSNNNDDQNNNNELINEEQINDEILSSYEKLKDKYNYDVMINFKRFILNIYNVIKPELVKLSNKNITEHSKNRILLLIENTIDTIINVLPNNRSEFELQIVNEIMFVYDNLILSNNINTTIYKIQQIVSIIKLLDDLKIGGDNI